jgi:transcriptional regulator with XRE-family HTH domain
MGDAMFERVTEEVGPALRRAREGRKLTLAEVSSISSGAFKPSTLASYERGERAVSIERFFRLTHLYRISPVRLLADVLRRIEGRPTVMIDVGRLQGLGGAEAGILDGFIRNVSLLRGRSVGERIALREGDLEVLATATGRRVDEFVDAIAPALAQEHAGR